MFAAATGTLAQLGAPQIAFGSGSLAFTAAAGGSAPGGQTVSLNCATRSAAFATNVNVGWLSVSPPSGVTPATVTIFVNPAGLLPGSYTGFVGATGACGTAIPLPVALTVVPSGPGNLIAGLIIAPPSLTFDYQAGAANPAVQALTLGGASQAVTLTASNAGWLSVSALTATAPAVVSVAVNPAGLTSGTYIGAIVLASAAGSQSVPVTLNVSGAGAPPPVVGGLSFSYQPGGSPPGPQYLPISGGAGGLAFTATAASREGWLRVSPSTGTLPATLTVSADPGALGQGTYTGSITITPGGLPVPVTLTVGPAPGLSAPRLTSLVNAASLLSSPLAPGEIISIFGSGLGPEQEQLMRITPGNLVDSALGGTRVIIDGKAAPVLYTRGGQVNTIVPYSVVGRSTIQAELEYQGMRAAVATFSVADAAPAIFTTDGSGRGQAAALNEDTSVNSDLNPVDRGTIAVLYGTGAGAMTPPVEDGAIAGTELSHPVLPVSVLVDGQNATVTYAGSAPGEVAGVLQVNFRIPSQVRTGAAVGVLLKVGRFTSQAGVTLAIR
jgi:uncharacterized protein (TIGR03437 family)